MWLCIRLHKLLKDLKTSLLAFTFLRAQEWTKHMSDFTMNYTVVQELMMKSTARRVQAGARKTLKNGLSFSYNTYNHCKFTSLIIHIISIQSQCLYTKVRLDRSAKNQQDIYIYNYS